MRRPVPGSPSEGNVSCPTTSTRRWPPRTASCTSTTCTSSPASDSTVFVMDVNSTITGPHVQPGFHPEARYEFKVHFDGADFEDLTYRVSFGERGRRRTADPAAARAHRRRRPRGLRRRRADARGPHRRDGHRRTASGSGPAASPTPFYIDLSLLAMVNAAVAQRTALDLRTGGRTRPRTASPAPPSSPSCSRCPTSTRSCGPAPASASGAPRSWPPTPAAGGRSTGPATR